jgi:hypothetical protein
MNKIQIQGKDYISVNERIMEFWKQHPEWSITTEVLTSAPDRIRIKATITNDSGRIITTGHGEEKEGSTFINKTSHVENCETSAIGRALGVLGIGIDTSLANFEEVANAIAQKDDPIDRTPKQYDDGREWLSEGQLNRIIERYNNGETDVIDRAFETFKIKKEYKEKLNQLKQVH